MKRTSKKTTKKPSLWMANPYSKEFTHLQAEIKKAYKKLEKDFKNKAHPKTLQEDNNKLFLLLGECHYLARECWKKTHPKK